MPPGPPPRPDEVLTDREPTPLLADSASAPAVARIIRVAIEAQSGSLAAFRSESLRTGGQVITGAVLFSYLIGAISSIVTSVRDRRATFLQSALSLVPGVGLHEIEY